MTNPVDSSGTPLPSGVTPLEGEQVLWTGRPYQGMLALRKMDAVLIPFSFMWCGFAVFWNALVWFGDGPLFFRLWGLPFLAIGLYVTVGRFAHNRHIRSRTRYVLTDERAIFVREGSTETVRQWPFRGQSPIETEARSDGSGSIFFDPSARSVSLWSPNPRVAMTFWVGPGIDDFVFYRIDDFHAVSAAVQTAIHKPHDR